MTAPNVGQVSVEVLADAKTLAKSLRSQVEDAFKGLDVAKLIRQSAGSQPIRVPVEPDVKTDEIPAKVRAARVPKVPVELDPLLSAFQAEVRSQVQALARTVNAKIPVGADGTRLRAELGAQLAEVQRSVKAEIPTEPGARGEYEAKLKAQLAEVSHRVKQTVKVDPDTKGGGFAAKIGGALSGFGGLIGSVPGLGAIQSALSGVTGSLLSAAGATGPLAGGIASAVGGVGALSAAAAVLPALFSAAAGAAAAIPAALSGAGAVAGTLFLGFKGISEAFKPKTGGGGGGGAGQSAAQQGRQVAAAARQVEAARRGIAAANRAYEASERSLAAAERGVVVAARNLVDAEAAVAVAQQRARDAQLAVSKARQEAADDLVDLNLQLKGSRLSEQEAALAVTDALRELNQVKLTGNIPDIQKADLAYQRAQQTLEEATQSSKELQKQTDDANKKGVSGSDKVKSALKDQVEALDGVHKAQEGVADAHNGVLDAADSLKSAQDGVKSAQDGIKSAADSLKAAQDGLAQASTKAAAGAGAVGAQVTKLAPSAQRFVSALKALKPAFEDLRLDVQQRLFDGLDKTVTNLGRAWIPALKVTLGSYADTFNGFFKGLGAALTTPKFIKDIQAGAEGARQGLATIGTSVTQSLVPAFGALSRAGGPFLAQFGREIAAVVREFSAWVLQGEKSGALTAFFDRARVALHSIFTTGKLVGKIIGDLFAIITGTQSTSGKSPLDSFNDGLQKIHVWLQDPANQKKLRSLLDDLQSIAGKVTSAAGAIGGFVGTLHHFADAVDGVRARVRGFFEKLFGLDDDSQAKGSGVRTGQSLGDGILQGLGNALGNIGNFLAGLLWSGPNSLVGRIKAGLGIHSPSTVMMSVGGYLIAGLIAGITGALSQLSATVGRIFGVVTGPLRAAGSWLLGHGRSVVTGMINGVGSMFASLSARAAQMRTVASNAVASAGSWLTSHGRNIVIGLGNGVTSMFGALRTWVSGARNWVQSALSGAGSWLVSAGRNVVIGLYNGIVSMGRWIHDRLIAFARAVVPGPIAKALGIASPSKVAHRLGVFVGQGLAEGITSQAGRVAAAADEVAASAVPQISDPTLGFGAGMNAALQTSLQASSQQQLQVSWNTGATSDPLLRALQNLINVQYRGNVQAAFTGS